MATKRKPEDRRNDLSRRPEKRTRQHKQHDENKTKLLFTTRPDWHAAEISPLPQNEVSTFPSQWTIDELHKYAGSLLEAENAAYNASHLSGSSSHKFLSTIMSSGTLEDKVSALTLLVQESPLHNLKAFENLLGLARKKSRDQALMAVAALKDLLGQGVVLPDRKLRAFGKQPSLLSALQGKGVRWVTGESLPGGLQIEHLVLWAYEDWLKRKYFELLQILESWCNDEVEYARSRAITYVWELLKDKPEQEENLLRLLVNKLGDTDRKIASRASYLLLQLENNHPAMKVVVTNSIESDCLFRPAQSLHAKYYGIITLNQTILSQKEQNVATRLLDIYFSLFVLLLKPSQKTMPPAQPQSKSSQQGGGGKAGKLAAKKRKSQERSEATEDQLREKMIAQVLTGVNRAFPFADVNDPTFEKQMDTIFRVAHSTNFNTSIQALMLLQQIASTKHYGAERFYRTLYESLLDPRLITSSKQVMYLNLIYKSLKADLNAKRVQAFVKRLLQVCTMHDPPFVCAVLYLISELEVTFPSVRNMMIEVEAIDEDEEERFVDVPEAVAGEHHDSAAVAQQDAALYRKRYEARKRDPEHAHADRSCLWDLLPYLQYFHPSVSLFAESLLFNRAMPPKPDPTQHTLMHFLDRFVYRNAKSKPTVSHGSSIMQPMADSNAADMLIKPGEGAARAGIPVNSEEFWRRKLEDVAADEVFFHSYFNQLGGKKRKAGNEDKKKRDMDDRDGSEDEAEEEIWQAIAQSRPEVDGPDSDDDLSLGDFESAYDGSDVESQPGIDLGGQAAEKLGDGESLGLGEAAEDEKMDWLSEFESGDDAMLNDEDDVPVDVAEPDEAEAGWKKKRKERKKLKQLPTFASADEYAQLLDGEPEDV